MAESRRNSRTTRRPPVKKNPSVEPSTPSTPSTTAVETVEGVEGSSEGAKHTWEMTDGLDQNFSKVGKRLSSLVPDLYQQGSGLLLVEDHDHARSPRPRNCRRSSLTTSASGSRRTASTTGSESPGEVLGDMLLSRHFLGNFPKVKEVVTTPIVLATTRPPSPATTPWTASCTLGQRSQPPGTGHHQQVPRSHGVAVQRRPHQCRRRPAHGAFPPSLPWGKPLVLVTATKSHSGKGTLVDFIRGKTAKAECLTRTRTGRCRRYCTSNCCESRGGRHQPGQREDGQFGPGEDHPHRLLGELHHERRDRPEFGDGHGGPSAPPTSISSCSTRTRGSLCIDLLNRSLPIRLKRPAT